MAASSDGAVEEEVGAVLDRFHQAASEADGDLYFDLLTEDAVFLGTDVTERWSVDQFKAFADPYFSKGLGWTYFVKERHILVFPGGGVARFDEVLFNETFGTCRGTGVLVLTPEGWRISQYSLTVPIPNEIVRDVTGLIKEHQESTGEKQDPSSP